jgi:hypothetical protein
MEGSTPGTPEIFVEGWLTDIVAGLATGLLAVAAARLIDGRYSWPRWAL